MRIVVVYESMFGATRQVASAIAEGLTPFGSVTIANVNDPNARSAAEVGNVLIAGGPTHAHGMSRPASRAEAQKWANDPAKDFTLEPSAPGTGVREWLDSLTDSPRFFAAFDTRVDIARILSGAASGGIDYRLSQRGGHRLVPASSFLVAKDGRLEHGELRRATLWSAVLGDAIAALKVSH